MSSDENEAEKSFENWQDEEDDFFTEIESELAPTPAENARTDSVSNLLASVSPPPEPPPPAG